MQFEKFADKRKAYSILCSLKIRYYQFSHKLHVNLSLQQTSKPNSSGYYCQDRGHNLKDLNLIKTKYDFLNVDLVLIYADCEK